MTSPVAVPDPGKLEDVPDPHEQADPVREASKSDVAAIFGVRPRTVNRWLKQGCPHTRDERGRLLLNVDEVRRWREQGHADEQETRSGGAPLASRASLAKADLVRRVTQAKRSELELAAEQALKDLGLDTKILAAKSYEDYVALDLEIGALLARGALSPSRARAIQAVIADARQNTKAHLDAEGDDEPERLILLTEEGAELVRAFEGVCSDERRQAILDYVHAESEVDLGEYPNVDLARAALEREGDPGQDDGVAEGADSTSGP